MINLDNTTRKVQVLLAGAVATTECPIVIGYEEVAGGGPGRGLGGLPGRKTAQSITTGATAVDALAAPASSMQRRVIAMSIYNADTTAVTVTVRLNDNGVLRIVTSVILQTLESLMYDVARGWYAVDANGNQKTNAPASSGASSTADSKAVQASSQASSQATSGSTVASTNLSTFTAASSTSSSSASLNTSAGTSVTLSKTKSSFGF